MTQPPEDPNPQEPTPPPLDPYAVTPGGQQPYGQPPAYGQSPPYGQPPPYGQYGPQQGTNGLAIASLITAFLCWPLGLIFGFIARSQIQRTGQKGAGLALAGIIIAFLNLAFTIIWVLTQRKTG